MSDLATAERLRPSTTQFPASWYCDPRVLEAERRILAGLPENQRVPLAEALRQLLAPYDTPPG